jgi:hypothetical protein
MDQNCSTVKYGFEAHSNNLSHDVSDWLLSSFIAGLELFLAHCDRGMLYIVNCFGFAVLNKRSGEPYR